MDKVISDGLQLLLERADAEKGATEAMAGALGGSLGSDNSVMVKMGQKFGVVYIETPRKDGEGFERHWVSGPLGVALKKFLQQQRVDDAFKVFGIPVAVSPSLKENEMALVDAKDEITLRPVDPLPENYTVGVDLANEPSKTVSWYMEGDALKAFLRQEAEFQKRDAVSSVENFFKLRQEEVDQDSGKQEEKHEVSEEEFVQSDFSEAAFMEAWAGRIQPTAGAIFCGKGATQISEGKAQPSKSGWLEEDFLKRDPAKPQKQQVENPDPEKKSENSLAGNTQEKVLKKLTSIGDRLDELRDFWAKNQIQRDAEIGPVVGFCAYCSHERRAGQDACANCGCRVMTSYCRDVKMVGKTGPGPLARMFGGAPWPELKNPWPTQPDQVAREEAARAAKHEKAMHEAMEREKQILKKQYEEMAESMGFSDGSTEEASNDTTDKV